MASIIRSVSGLSKCFYQRLWLADLARFLYGFPISIQIPEGMDSLVLLETWHPLDIVRVWAWNSPRPYHITQPRQHLPRILHTAHGLLSFVAFSSGLLLIDFTRFLEVYLFQRHWMWLPRGRRRNSLEWYMSDKHNKSMKICKNCWYKLPSNNNKRFARTVNRNPQNNKNNKISHDHK